MFGPKASAGPLAFPVPELPPTVRTRSAFPFPFPAHDLPEEPLQGGEWFEGLEAPALFVAGALAGCSYAFCSMGLTHLLMRVFA